MPARSLPLDPTPDPTLDRTGSIDENAISSPLKPLPLQVKSVLSGIPSPLDPLHYYARKRTLFPNGNRHQVAAREHGEMAGAPKVVSNSIEKAGPAGLYGLAGNCNATGFPTGGSSE